MDIRPVERHLYDPLLPLTWLFRLAVAIFTVTAGVVALFTDRALVDREKPLSGFWRMLWGTPLETRKLSPWGYKILAVLFLAGILQFCGDLLKDEKSDRDNQDKLDRVALEISTDVGEKVDNATAENKKVIQGEAIKQTNEVVNNVGVRLAPVIREQREIARSAEHAVSSTDTVLNRVNEGLYPFKNVAWSWEYDLDEQNKTMKSFISSIGALMEKSRVPSLEFPPTDQYQEFDEESLNDKFWHSLASSLYFSSQIYVEVRDEQGNPLLKEWFQAPQDFEKVKPYFTQNVTNEFNNPSNANPHLRCSLPGFPEDHATVVVPNDQTYDKIVCRFRVYSGAPVVDVDAARSSIHYLDQLAGKYLILTGPATGYTSQLRRVCLHVDSQSLCYSADQLNHSSRGELFVQLPTDLASILAKMTPGTLERTSWSPATRVGQRFALHE